MTRVEHWLDMLRHSGESRNPEIMISQETPLLFEKLQGKTTFYSMFKNGFQVSGRGSLTPER